MTILQQADPGALLDQGDLLADVPLFRTQASGEPETAGVEGAVMVISRPCNAMRDRWVVVVPVVQGNIPQIRGPETPEELIPAYTRIRDGEGAADRFYLGESPGKVRARFFAKLNEFYTIEVPVDPQQRQAWLRAKRTLCLDRAFARDLHLRLFRALASLGFDDEGWWPDSDLELVVRQCDAWAATADASVTACDARLDVLRQSGDAAKVDLKKASQELDAARSKVSELRGQYAPLRRELDLRRAAR